MDEKEIIKQIKSGDTSAFDQLVTTYQPKIFQHCLSVVKDQEIAEDLVQETFVRAYQKLDSFRQDASFYTWLYRIAHNLSLNQLRKMKHLKEEEFVEKAAPLAEEKDPLIQQAIREGLSQLNEKHREVFELYEFEKKSQKEIAVILDLPPGTVRSRLHYARKKMRTYLINYFKTSSDFRR